MDKAVAAGRLASREARKAAVEGALLVEERYGHSTDYQAAKAGVSRARHLARETATWAMDEAGQSVWGSATGSGARGAAHALKKLPVLTLIGDTVRARHGVDHLAERLRSQPRDAATAVHLAEAMHRCEAEMRAYTRVRTATSLTYGLRQKLVATTLELGTQDQEGSRMRLLKATHARLHTTIRRDPEDAVALELMARVLLLAGRFDDAAAFAKISILANAAPGHAWVTLARAYLALEQHSNGVRAAERAIALGFTFGHEVHAMATLQLATPGLEAISAFEKTRALVSDEDKRAYLGHSADARSITETILASQMNKYDELTSKGARA
jgi:hypothetical protein